MNMAVHSLWSLQVSSGGEKSSLERAECNIPHLPAWVRTLNDKRLEDRQPIRSPGYGHSTRVSNVLRYWDFNGALTLAALEVGLLHQIRNAHGYAVDHVDCIHPASNGGVPL